MELQTQNAWRPAILAAVLGHVVGLTIVAGFLVVLGYASSFAQTVRLAVVTWLFMGGSSLNFDGATIGVMPLGVMVLEIVVIYFITGWLIRNEPVDPKVFAPIAAGIGGLIAAVLAAIVSTDVLSVPIWRAALMFFVVFIHGSGIAASHRAKQYWWNIPTRWWHVAEGGSAMMMFFFGSAIVTLLLLLATSLDESANMWASLNPGGGGVMLGVFLILVVPTVVMWVSAVFLGTPVYMGEGSYVDLAATHLDRLPVLPVLSAVPDPGPHPSWALALALIPLLSGIFGGVLVRVQVREQIALSQSLREAAIAGLGAGAATGLLILTSSGGLGTGVLNTAGPPAWIPGLIAMAVFTLGALLGSTAAHYRLTREQYRF